MATSSNVSGPEAISGSLAIADAFARVSCAMWMLHAPSAPRMIRSIAPSRRFAHVGRLLQFARLRFIDGWQRARIEAERAE